MLKLTSLAKMDNKKGIGNIGNYYGRLFICKHGRKYYWIIENYNTDFSDILEWEEIPKELYDSLMAFSAIAKATTE